jgi:cytochrome c553
MSAALSDADMKNVSAWLGSKTSAPNFAKEKDLVVLGERIYRGGVAERQIAACGGCHNPTGAGIPAQYPPLAGQHADYTVSQLNAFREHGNKGAGQNVGRGNSAQMSGVAAKLNDREIKAVSDYVAGLR